MRVILACILLISTAFLLPPATAQTASACEVTLAADVVLVLDRSGSMTSVGLPAVKDSASHLLGKMRDEDHSALVSFAHESRIDKTLDNDHATTDLAVQSLAAGGGTATGLGIDLGHAEFTANKRVGVNHVMIVLTDGNTNSGPDLATEAAQAKADGITVYAIGYGLNINEAELKTVASDESTTYYHPLTPAQLDEVFDAIIDAVVGNHGVAADAHDLFVEVTEPALPGAARVDRVHHVIAPDDAYRESASVSITEAGLELTARFVWAEASTRSDGDQAVAHGAAAIHDLQIDFLGIPLLSADVVRAEADATAAAGDSHADTDGAIVGLVVNGDDYAVTPPDVALPFGYVRFLEDKTVTTADTAQAWMDAIHVFLTAPTGETIEVVVSHAYAGALCGEGSLTPPPGPTDDPLLPTCLLGYPVEVPVDPVNVVELDLCAECPPTTPPRAPPLESLPRPSASYPAVGGVTPGRGGDSCVPCSVVPPTLDGAIFPDLCDPTPGPCDVPIVGVLVQDLGLVNDCQVLPCDPNNLFALGTVDACVPLPCDAEALVFDYDVDSCAPSLCDPTVDPFSVCVPPVCEPVPDPFVPTYCSVPECLAVPNLGRLVDDPVVWFRVATTDARRCVVG